MESDEGHGDGWVEDMASLVMVVIFIVIVLACVGGVYMMVTK